ncbi:uncharacterized protein LOC143282861 isoform X2 [Babylonia areolata]|uniref:uncharacterized protein LOC143282861 isoform X2 n=1 Tax=Babylonia areolata TaxID=304850 RepID=UPI003FCF2587
MADKEGHVTMADTQVKSLVSEQYLDGWAYDDDDDESGSGQTSPPSCESETTQQSSVSGKRHYVCVDSEGSCREPVEKKKFSMSFGAKGEGGGVSKAEGPPAHQLLSKSSVMSGAPKKIEMSFGSVGAKPKAAPIKMNLSSQTKTKAKEVPAASSVKKSSAVAKAFGDDSDERNPHCSRTQLLWQRQPWVLQPSEDHGKRTAKDGG